MAGHYSGKMVTNYVYGKTRCNPYTIALIIAIRGQLNLNDPLDAAVFACLTTTFFTCACVREFTICHLDAFSPMLHVKPSNIQDTQDHQGLKITNFHLPCTKISIHGEDVSWAKQDSPSHPEEALQNHLHIIEPPPDNALFTYRHKNFHQPLTKMSFLKRLASAMKATGHRPLQGHGICIGSMLKYLLHNVLFDVVKTQILSTLMK
ncbi:hypothetical protein BDR05DRAFT_978771 [Suillus weaverae]|nr:hypothetical protein BDR05DRAFT_978771 [Suillus weaverae]